ncbi:gliding motility lipoprotein GldH [Sphingobacterium faecium]|uniref:gliding motility lipoprotein GldH n=1 Tax=Sphingobacterium faecium TaxID=34087 RepID=UPI002468D911|nr:gliding motility lipoprotein GldH [Sphingobacterium faecium]MDH5828475.1 gliding motility lipoprotein GldH [Sphingobacterium faecium]
MKKSTFLIGCMTISLFVSCDSNTIMDENVNINKNAWAHAYKPTFDVHISDISKKYDVWLNVRHTSHYPYSNLFILVHQKGANTKLYTYKKELKLADSYGKWTGNTAGSLYTKRSLIHKDYSFPDTGLYHFTFEQNMRDNPLLEVTDIGLNITSK